MVALESRIMQQDHELDLIRDELVKAMRLAEQGKHRPAVELCQRTLKTAAQKSLPLPEGFVAALLTRMGLSLAALDDMEPAILHYRLAEGVLLRRKESIRQVRQRYEVVLYTTDDDLRLLLADIYQALGTVYELQQETERAISYYRQAYKIAQTMENPGLSWRAMHAIATHYQQRTLWPDLQEAAEELLKINQADPQPTREIVARRLLAQAYGKLGALNEMLAELQHIVGIGKQVSHPDLPYDERALARAQQTLNPRSTDTGTVAVVQAEPNVMMAKPPEKRAMSVVEVTPVPEPEPVRRTTPTPPEATEIPEDFIQGVQLELETQNETQDVAFVLQTRYVDRAAQLLSWFRPTLLAVNLPSMRQLPHEGIDLPRQGQLQIELSLPDLLPNQVLHTLTLSEAQIAQLEIVNRRTNRIAFYVEGKDGPFARRRRVPLTGIFESYTLDWRGMTGIVRHLRRVYMQPDMTLQPQDAHHLLTLLQVPLKEGFRATGLYREMGYIYRMIGDTGSAAQCFRDEIVFSMGATGLPGSHAAQSFRQLGELHIERSEPDLAFDALRWALALNPNSFDALTTMGTFIKDPTEALRYLGRAYRIRKQDPVWNTVAERAAERFRRTVQQIEQAAAIVAVQVDLSSPYEFDPGALVRLGIR